MMNAPIEDNNIVDRPAEINSDPKAVSETTNEEQKRFRCSFPCVVLNGISLAFFVLFLVAACLQTFDGDGIQWIIYYLLQADVPFFFLMSYYTEGRFPVEVVYIFSSVNVLWSIIYIAMGAMDINGVPEGEKLDVIYEVGGASIALFSSFYHCIVTKYCVDKRVDEVTEEVMSEQAV